MPAVALEESWGPLPSGVSSAPTIQGRHAEAGFKFVFAGGNVYEGVGERALAGSSSSILLFGLD